jgi:hypothetical protein
MFVMILNDNAFEHKGDQLNQLKAPCQSEIYHTSGQLGSGSSPDGQVDRDAGSSGSSRTPPWQGLRETVEGGERRALG